MKNLIRLVKTLNTKEIHYIKRMHKTQETSMSKDNMCMKLFDYILKNQVTNNKQALELVCPNKHNSTISQVKKRLELDVLNAMLISSLTDEKEPFKKNEINCQKNLLLGNVLLERGLHDEAVQLLHMTSVEAARSEFHDIKIRCDDLLMSVYRESITEPVISNYSDDITLSLEGISSLLHAKSVNYPFLTGRSFSEPDLKEEIDLKKISDYIRNSQSKKAIYWYEMAIIHHYIQKKEYDTARQLAGELLEKTWNTAALNSAFERNEFFLQLARIFVYLGEFMLAIRAAEGCMETSARGGAEVTPSSQMLFRAYLLSGNITKAGEVADRALKYLHDSGDSNGGIWYLFKSAFFFIQNMFRESHQVLISQEQHFTGSLPQKTFAKFLELIDILEQGDLQWFEYKAESFRKRLERIHIYETDRLKQLYDLLKIVAHKAFPDFRFSADKIAVSLASFDSHPIQWDPLGYEVINLGEWIRKKL